MATPKLPVTALYFPFCDGGKIVTYKVQVCNALGEEVSTWEHHFWSELIEFDETL